MADQEPKPKFTPEELAEIELQIPAFKRKHKITARMVLRKNMSDLGKRGGVYSPLDPINQNRLLGYGEPNQIMNAGDIIPPSSDSPLTNQQKERFKKDIKKQ
ncbi:hypothetical protein HYS95_01895 [Candidatus Daviesbacteria bacterium]|nr:hypothetical protein [Candidatus Daviesbacteria bacterium]